MICYLITSVSVFVVINAGLFESAIDAIKYYMRSDNDTNTDKLEPKLKHKYTPKVKKKVRFTTGPYL